MIVVEGKKSVHIASAAWLVDDTREMAWAEKHVIKNPAYAWVVGKYVGANKANDNGHIFDATELTDARHSLVHAPMNMLHRPTQIMGVYVANEVIWPKDASTSVSAAAGKTVTETEPFLEALAAFYKYYFPEEFETVRMAHNEGTLAWSMECVPTSVTCAANMEECGKTFPYMGRQDESYCAHLNMPAAPKRLNKPHFTAGALVLPPARPAWRNANVTEFDNLIVEELEAAESLYEQAAEEFPHLDATAWEAVMAQLLAQVAAADDKKKDGGKHAYAPVNKFIPNAVCKICGKKSGGPTHTPAKAEDIGRDVAKKV